MLKIGTQTWPDARAALVGELDLATTNQLDDALAGLEIAGPERLVLDLADLEFVDIRGLHALIDATQRAQRLGKTLVLERARPAVRRLLAISGADESLYLADADDELSLAEL